MFSLFLSVAAVAQQPSARDLLPDNPLAPGCALDVRRNGVSVEAIATGAADLETPAAITADTVFEIGSVSKQFIGAGLAILAERGRLRMEDKVTRWLPELPPLYRGVTIAMLAHHTSGIRSWNNLAELTGRGEDSTGYDNAWVLAAIARQRALNNAPGAEYLYSNSNFVLAAIIIERAGKQELNAFFRNALFDRLGMRHTEWRVDFRKVVPGRAQAYAPTGSGGWRLDMPLNGVAGAGGLLSTVGDLQRWSAALADPAPADHGWVAALLLPGRLSDGTALRYGLGIETDPIAGRPAWSHGGSTGSYRAWLGTVPSVRLSVALLCNSGAVNTEDLGPAVAARFLPPPSPSPATVRRPASGLASYTGIYRNIANDAAVEATANANGLHLNGGAGFFVAARDRLETADGKRTISARRTAAGAVTALTVTRIGNAPLRLTKETRWTPSAADLSRIAGAYASAEIDGVQRMTVEHGALVWRDPSGAAIRLVPVYHHGFEAPEAGWTLRFVTRPSGKVALNLSITRARRIAFDKVGASRQR